MMEDEKLVLTRKMRWQIADMLAADRLPAINAKCTPVIVKDSFYTRYGKRFIDIIVSSVALLLFIPLNLLIAIITYFDVGRPILFQQERTGKDGSRFIMYKFRNMTNEKDERGELLPPEQRITKFGRLMRKTSLDELLNFWNIFKGDLSLIGPRPIVPEYETRYNDRHKMRLAIRPGLECPPRYRLDHVRTWHEQFENDVWYVENVSFFVDCLMVFRLLQFALDKKSIEARADTSRGTFMGYNEYGIAINMNAVPKKYIAKVKQMKDVKITG